MATYETIGPVGTGSNYTTPQAWVNAHISSSAGSPFIGIIKAGVYSANYSVLDFSVVTGWSPDPTHYFRLEAASGQGFRGAFDGNYPLLSATATSSVNQSGYSPALCVIPISYCQFDGIVASATSTIFQGFASAWHLGYAYQASSPYNVLFDRCAAYNVTASDAQAYGFAVTNREPALISNDPGHLYGSATLRNCVAAKIYSTVVSTTGNAKAARAVGFCFDQTTAVDFVRIYHCVAHDIKATQNRGDAGSVACGISAVCQNTTIRNSAIGNLAAAGGTSTTVANIFAQTTSDISNSGEFITNLDCDYNGATAAIAQGSHNIVFSPSSAWANVGSGNWDFHQRMVLNPPLLNKGKLTPMYTLMPTTDVDGDVWYTGGPTE